MPYLNGGLFDVHDLERDNPEIHIPDAAFQTIFAFFDAYQWHLDDRPLHNDKEINPDVLGYIFEKYINQKQMGAYYTKEDITGYISRNTIIPFLFDQAKRACPIAMPDSVIADTKLHALADALVDDLESNAEVRVRRRADGSERREVNYFVGKSKKLIDEIDRTLARHYGFTDEELDFIINYDIKYRMGREADK